MKKYSLLRAVNLCKKLNLDYKLVSSFCEEECTTTLVVYPDTYEVGGKYFEVLVKREKSTELSEECDESNFKTLEEFLNYVKSF